MGVIITIIALVVFSYWGIQAVKVIPAILRWILLVLTIIALLPVTMVKSLPLYLKKGGKMYKYRYLVIFNFILYTFILILFFLPV